MTTSDHELRRDPAAGPAPFDTGLALQVIERLPVAVVLFAPTWGAHGQVDDLVCTFANAAARDLIDVDQVVGIGLRGRLAGTMAADDAARLWQTYLTAYEQSRGEPIHVGVVPSEDQTRHFDVRARRVAEVLVVEGRDVTAERAAREAAARAQQAMSATLERINDAVYSVDEDWNITFSNGETARIVGQPVDELIGRNLWEQFPGLTGNEFERQLRHAAVHRTTVTFEAYYAAPLHAWFAVRAYPGEHGLTVFFQNVHARHHAEERAVDLERLESTAMLARGASQDFNNLLMVIGGHAELLEESLDPGDPRLDDVRPIRSAVRRATELSRQLLAFGHTHEPHPAVLDLSAAIQDAAPVLRQMLPAKVTLTLHPAEEPVLVDVDPEQLNRAFLHLAANAAQAMPNGGAITIAVHTLDVDDAQSVAHPERAPGRYGVITVTDEGRGMTDEVLERALEPFFTTRRTEGATGLGLSAVNGMVRRAGGFVSLTCGVSTGTTVGLHLPLTAPE